MSSMMETLQIRKQVSLPVSQRPTSSTTTDDDKPAGEQARSWWEWSRSWILSKKLDQSAHHITEEVV
ncbi:hypothetical protein HID58_078709 [Brassica napus]|uniref:Uncharacterized protein n=1 Tax=Brassica napus TaxID=3708 RepID=A0ABQ7YUS2_BRANA|nr:hypothetical protein HID58_078709 [Brassica napus]